MEHKIIGDDMQLVEIALNSGESIRAETGTMLYMNKDIDMETNTGGGLLKGFKRALTGENFFITTYTHNGQNKGQIAFGAPYPGKIIKLDLTESNKEFLCQKDSFLCASDKVEIDIAFTKKLGAGFFGGEGFILQRLKGKGEAFIHAGGTIVEKVLGVNEIIKVDTGCIVAFESGVDYDIKMIKGVKNMLFGGEGIFLATLTGPGKIYLQSLPFSRLASRINNFAPKRGENRGVVGTMLGGDRSF
ncbi:MAG: TIGR00266 family protein [DPANN group archaeon]|nr:TIGR00266 family protein [DPANN group archaeon]